MEATAKRAYIAQKATELTFKKNATVLIFSMLDSEQYKGEVDGVQGLVSSELIDMKPHDFFEEESTRERAEFKLATSNLPSGAFIIRSSENFENCFSLTFKCQDTVEHVLINRNENLEFYIWKDKSFKSVNKLVDYYKKHDVCDQYRIKLVELRQNRSSSPNSRSLDRSRSPSPRHSR